MCVSPVMRSLRVDQMAWYSFPNARGMVMYLCGVLCLTGWPGTLLVPRWVDSFGVLLHAWRQFWIKEMTVLVIVSLTDDIRPLRYTDRTAEDY